LRLSDIFLMRADAVGAARKVFPAGWILQAKL
jgi:hypothetical protein